MKQNADAKYEQQKQKMSLKAEIETWAAALEAYDAQDFATALERFEPIADSSKILVNVGLIHATLGEHDVAVKKFRAATELDRYLAIAYFQSGVSSFLLGSFADAVHQFEHAFVYLRGNLTIDYSQLGLKFKLYSCEVLFNKGLALLYQGREQEGMAHLAEAQREKQTEAHNVIDEAYAAQGEDYTVFSIPVGVVYRPSANKLNNLKTKNYLGTAKLVAATDTAETFVGFSGSERRERDAEEVAGDSTVTPLVRRGTAAARIEGTSESATKPLVLRRRPTDNTATFAPAPVLSRSISASAAGPRSRPVRKESLRAALRPVPEDRPPPKVQLPSSPDQISLLLERYGVDSAPSSPAPVAVASELRYASTTRSASRALQNIAFASPESSDHRTPSPPSTTGSSHNSTDSADAAIATLTFGRPPSVRRMRVKLYHGMDTRGMSVDLPLSLAGFRAKIAAKFCLHNSFVIRYLDEDGAKLNLVDDDDWDLALEEADRNRKADEGRLETWISAT